MTTGKFEIIKDSIGSITSDKRMQALLIAFAFGAFIEGCAGFGTPVAVAAAMMVGLGFSSLYASSICLLANTAPVAFGSIGIPVITLAGITGLPLERVGGVAGLSGVCGRLTAPMSLFLPAYLILVTSGFPAMLEVWPAVLTCGSVFAAIQFCVSNYIGPQLTDILSSISAMGALVILLRFWEPRHTEEHDRSADESMKTPSDELPLRLPMIFGLRATLLDARNLVSLDALRSPGHLRPGMGIPAVRRHPQPRVGHLPLARPA